MIKEINYKGTDMYVFQCPACNIPHSILSKRKKIYSELRYNGLCEHKLLGDNAIEFSKNSTHSMAGQTVETGPIIDKTIQHLL